MGKTGAERLRESRERKKQKKRESNAISVFNSHFLGNVCMYFFFLCMELLFYIRVMVTAFAD